MPSAELIGLQAPKKAHRSLVFALAAACRQIESAGLIGAASHSSFGGGELPRVFIYFSASQSSPSNIQNATPHAHEPTALEKLATEDRAASIGARYERLA